MDAQWVKGEGGVLKGGSAEKEVDAAVEVIAGVAVRGEAVSPQKITTVPQCRSYLVVG